MIITKIAENQNYIRKIQFFNNARSAFEYYLSNLKLEKEDTILLPSYIGWSSREGSGIFDPIKSLKLKYNFYHLDKNLNIDFLDLEKKIKNNTSIKVLLIVHYFGFPEPRMKEIINITKSFGIKVIEDSAHSSLTDIIGGKCGRLGDVTFYSLHKILPLKFGGALVFNSNNICKKNDFNDISLSSSFYQFDLKSIASIRYRNAQIIYKKLQNYPELFEFIKPLEENVFPQTIPIFIKNGKRDHLYFTLNNLGYGVVSLYHELISEIGKLEYPLSHNISNHILNLPVHQDINVKELELFLDTLISQTEKSNDIS
jgi:dTDP-4-amino-4,6-dideoxygalactose transaminase